MIEIRNVSHEFDARPILRGITLSLSERRIAVIGANGSGKTTLARMLNGLILPDRGEVTVDGLSTKTDGAAIRALVGFVFQNPEHQIIMPTVEEDLAFGPQNLNLPKAEVAERVEAMLAAHGLTEKRNAPAHLLSGGEQKLLTLISVLIMQPRYVIFDEPMNSLDLAARRRLSRLMDGLAQSVITITHDFELIAHYDRAILIHDGIIAADGPPREIISRYVAMIDERDHPGARPSPVAQ
jgi:biotin transport system ATP-binding protein